MKELTEPIKKILAENPAMAEVYLDDTLTNHQRKLRMLPFVRHYRKELVDNKKKYAFTQSLLENLQQEEVALSEFISWHQQENKRLEKNEHSRLHKLIAEFKAGRVIFAEEEKTLNDGAWVLWPDLQDFVVQHDWASAFNGSADYEEGVINLPYQKCAFEFRIGGKNIIVLAFQAQESELPFTLLGFVECAGRWICTDAKAKEIKAFHLAWDEIRAICIALDAEVATHSVVRQSEKLNQKRIKEDKEPLHDFHVVSLSRRIKVINPAGGVSGSRKRLHFRRGHWRHFYEFKTWVRWTLVGNPELGFIDKEYKL